MNTFEILNEMNNLNCFKGVFPLDKIKNLKINERPIGLILNLDYAYQPGSHWVAVYLEENNKVTYFDSFGFPNFNQYFLNFLKINKVNEIIFNKFQLQSINSQTCGAYCVLFLKMRCHGYSLNDFMKLFSNNKENNDNIASLILE